MIGAPVEPTGEGAPVSDAALATADALAAPATADAATPATAASTTGGANVVVAPSIDSGANPFDDQVWRVEGGSDSEADVARVRPVVAGSSLRDAVIAFAKNRRGLAIAAGAALLVIVVLAFAIGGSDEGKTTAPAKHAAKAASDDTTTRAAGDEPGPGVAQGHESAAAGPADETAGAGDTAAAASEDTPPSDTAASEDTPPSDSAASGDAPSTDRASDDTQPAAKSATRSTGERERDTIGGKKVVLEYDTQAREAKPVPNAAKADQSAISKARTYYAAGNTRLFSGDADGAIKNYRQALRHYPGYVAGYRGLGLAYAQKGDKAKAIRALRTYVGAAPQAKDASLIRKRIQSLSK